MPRLPCPTLQNLGSSAWALGRKSGESRKRENLLPGMLMDKQLSKVKLCSIDISRYRRPRPEESYEEALLTKVSSVPRTLPLKDRIEDPQVLALELGRTTRILHQTLV